jgi:hypothetical protein
MLALIIVVCVGAITTLGNNANTTYTSVGNAIATSGIVLALALTLSRSQVMACGSERIGGSGF